MVPRSLLRHSATITRPTKTGRGITTTTIASDVPTMGSTRVRSQLMPEGPVVYSTRLLIFAPDVDVQVGDVLTYQGGEYRVQEATTPVGPNGRPSHIQVVAW